MSTSSSLILICTLGRGGSGKDTQVALFTSPYLEDRPNPNYLSNSIKISTGDIIRQAQTPGNILYDRYYFDLEPFLADSNSGGLIPDEQVLAIVEREIARLYLGGIQIFFFTGFPRTQDQLNSFSRWMNNLENDGISVKSLFVNFDVPETTSRDRAQARRQKAKQENKPIRQDDNKTVVEKRLATFREHTQPMLDMLAGLDKLITIPANRSIEEIFKDFQKAIHQLLK